MTRSLTPPRVIGMLAVAALVVGFLALAPSSLGGTATWVSTTGISMEPDISTGDLVIARPDHSYEVGDVVAYPSDTLEGTVVLHRIVDENDTGFVTQGDNNYWLDPDYPRSSEILGELWLHIPGGGRMLSIFANPLVVASLALALMTLGWLGTAQVRRRRGRNAAIPARRRDPRTSTSTFGELVRKVRTEHAAMAAVAAVALSIFAFSQPTTTAAPQQVDVTHTAELTYSAAVDTPGVYIRDTLQTGDPVFLSLAPAIDTKAEYRLQGDADKVAGTISAAAHVSASNGWERTIQLTGPHPFTGTAARATARVDLRSVLETVHRAEKAAGTSFGSYTLDVVYDVTMNGEVSGQPVQKTYQPKLSFSLDDVQALPQGTDGDSTNGVVDTAQVAVPGIAPATVTLLRWDIPVTVLRAAAIVLAVAALALILLVRTRGRQSDDGHAIFAGRLVTAAGFDLAGRTVVDVQDASSLMRVATMYDAVIVAVFEGDARAYYVSADQTVYRYAAQVMRPTEPRRHVAVVA